MLRCALSSIALAALVVCTSSCLSPTLPLPPPSIDAAAQGVTGLWEISGSCLAGATVSAQNDTELAKNPTEQGAFVICSMSGRYALGLSGKQCDSVRAWQGHPDEDDGSVNTSILLQAFQNDEPVDPNACPF